MEGSSPAILSIAMDTPRLSSNTCKALMDAEPVNTRSRHDNADDYLPPGSWYTDCLRHMSTKAGNV